MSLSFLLGKKPCTQSVIAFCLIQHVKENGKVLQLVAVNEVRCFRHDGQEFAVILLFDCIFNVFLGGDLCFFPAEATLPL